MQSEENEVEIGFETNLKLELRDQDTGVQVATKIAFLENATETTIKNQISQAVIKMLKSMGQLKGVDQ